MNDNVNKKLQFQIWKTIKVGTYDTTEGIIEALEKEGFSIGYWAIDVLNSPAFMLASVESELDLVRISPTKLGFKDGAYRKDIYKQALDNGLTLCPLEVGPQLRLQYKNQPVRESLQIGMEAQVDREGHESEFRVVHSPTDGPLWLVGDHKHPDDFWEKNEYFIFVK